MNDDEDNDDRPRSKDRPWDRGRNRRRDEADDDEARNDEEDEDDRPRRRRRRRPIDPMDEPGMEFVIRCTPPRSPLPRGMWGSSRFCVSRPRWHCFSGFWHWYN